MKMYDLPRIRTSNGLKDYNIKEVSRINDNSIRGAENEMRCVDYYKIGNFSSGSNYFKYMDFDTALICLKSGKLRFAEPSRWDDQYESRFYTADYGNILKGQKEGDVCPVLYASCFTNKMDNEPAWKIYTYGKSNGGSKCIQFKLDRKMLRGELIKHLANCCVYEGCVSYFWQGFIDSMHRKNIKIGHKIKLHSLFFDDFDYDKYLNLMLLKRDSFEHEHEIRIMIVRDEDKIDREKAEKHKENGKTISGHYIDVQINWSNVIKEVRYDASLTKAQRDELKDVMKKVDNSIMVKPYYVNGKKAKIIIEG